MITLYFYKDTPESTQIHCKFATSPCFRIFLAKQNSPINKLKEEGKHLLYVAWVNDNTSLVRESVIRKIMDNNPLYPNHKVIPVNKVREVLQDINLIQSNIGEDSDRDFSMTLDRLSTTTLVMVNLRPTGYENRGIPCEQFIHGLFTARNSSSLADQLSNNIPFYEAKNIHPFFAYLDMQLFNTNLNFYSSSTSGGVASTRYRGGGESDNIDIHSFGSKSHQKLQDFFNKTCVMDTHPLDLGNYLFNIGGYFRDNMYSSSYQYVRRVDGLGSVRRRMASCLSLYEGDDSIFTTTSVTFMNLRYIFNALYRTNFFDVPEITMTLTEGQEVYIDTRKMEDHDHEKPIPPYPLLTLQGSLFKKDKVIGVDTSRTQPVLLEKMGWVTLYPLSATPIPELEDSLLGREFKIPKTLVVGSYYLDLFDDEIKGVVIGTGWRGTLKVYLYDVALRAINRESEEASFSLNTSLEIQHHKALVNTYSAFDIDFVRDISGGEVTWI